MPFTKFTNLDFDQIKTSIRDYLRANSNFTDFDFEGSNFSILIDTLAYNTYITAFNTNMVVNESFLDSATLRENIVSLARTIGYVPKSRTSARALVYFDISTSSDTPTLTLDAGLVCVGNTNDSSYIFSIPESITTTVVNGVASFGTADNPIKVYQGTFLKKQFTVTNSLDQRFILDNSFIDTSTIVVKVKGQSDTGEGKVYRKIDNILNTDSTAETYLLQEIKDERYELLFGDGIFGKKIEDGSIITVTYIITDGESGNGPSVFDYAGTVRNSLKEIIPSNSVQINTALKAQGGGEIESADSIKYFAPRLYSSQYRAVTAKDYESIIQTIYPNTESVSVVGGENLDPPQYGKVFISIKPKNGDFVSDFDKQSILSEIKNYSLVGIRQEIVDIKVLYVEIDTSIYYNSSMVSDVSDLKTRVFNTLTSYSKSLDLNKFGGRFKYSKILQLIDNVDDAISSNITKVIIRRNLNASINKPTQYELCFGNSFHVNPNGFNIKSTGFKVFGEQSVVYFTDIPNPDGKTGILSIVKRDSETDTFRVVQKSIGSVDYITGEINISTVIISSTVLPNDIIQIQAYPESNDVIGLKDLYLAFDISNSKINMIKDTISSGEQISGIGFKVVSSYSNGEFTRK